METYFQLNPRPKLLVLLFCFITIGQTAQSLPAGKLSKIHSQIEVVKSQNNPVKYSGYVVSRITGNPIADAQIIMKSYQSGIKRTIRTDKEGYYEFNIDRTEKIKLLINSDGYSAEVRIVKLGKNTRPNSTNNRIYLTPFESLVENKGGIEKIKVNDETLNTDTSTTEVWNEVALEKVLYTMLKFPEIRIKIESHSNKGETNVSNSVISYFNAKAARRYLIRQGIAPKRIESARGQDISYSKENCSACINDKDQNLNTNEGSDFIIVQQ